MIMSPEKARVFVAEDNKTWQKIIAEYITAAGHEVILTATTLEEAEEAIVKFSELGIQVAILDGNLGEYSYESSDGRYLLSLIRKNSPDVKTIGMSAISVPGTDIDLGKENARDLGKTITNF